MKKTNEDFIGVYEALKVEVNRRSGTPKATTFNIDRASNRDRVVHEHSQVLEFIGRVRNLLAHPKHASSGDAIMVTDGLLDEAKQLLTRLKDPPRVSSLGVPCEDLKIARLGDQLGTLATEMRQRGFSHLPILNEKGVVIGVFNEAAVFDHLWSDTEIIIGWQMTILEILEHCSLDANHTETFRFVGSRTTVDDLIPIFLAIESPTTRVGAAFVTASGNETEPLQRMITPWDILATLPGDERPPE